MPPEIQDEKVLELQRKLEERRQQRLMEQESAKIRPGGKSLRRGKELSASKVMRNKYYNRCVVLHSVVIV